jgi:hypothetical protein
LERVLKNLEKGVESREEEVRKLVVGDFNARTGEEEGRVDITIEGEEREMEEEKRFR